jgi:nicotinamide phosphoribosyltransferase
MFYNLLLNTDSYKSSHAFCYPTGTEYVYSYIESRGGKFDRTVFFGLQMWLKEYVVNRPITQEMVDEAAEFWSAHGEPFNREGWEYIVNELGGRLPVRIDAVAEGTVIPTHNVLLTIVNTDPKCFWLTSFLETAILRAVWYPTTVATVSWQAKQIIRGALEKSAEEVEGQLVFKMHDFGARGVSSLESAAIGGAAHLVNFMGSDTVSGVLAARKYYGEPMAGVSIPAAEHSVITSWGKDNESKAYANMLKKFAKPGSLVAVVSDSYDLMKACREIWGDELRRDVIESGATVVVRPDSGDPLTVPVEVVAALGERFGYTINSKGYKVLPSCVRVIQGDGINIETLPVILENLLSAGWSADNLAFGMGGGLLQQVNRDTQKFAMKCSAAYINGEWIDVFKDPITDPGKKSKKGQVRLWECGGKFETSVSKPNRWVDCGTEWKDCLETVFENGKLMVDHSFKKVREKSNVSFSK